jgi:hypothetical protein
MCASELWFHIFVTSAFDASVCGPIHDLPFHYSDENSQFYFNVSLGHTQPDMT